MKVVTNFDFKLNRNLVINMLKSYRTIIGDTDIHLIYEKLLPVLYDSIKPAGVFTIDKKDNNYIFDIISNYNYIVYCIVTMGNECTEIIDELFLNNKNKEGIILDCMATSYLFNVSSQLFNHVYFEAKQSGLGLSCRIAPGDGEIPLWYQKHIINKLNAESFLDIHMIECGFLSPLKSMTYIYGADKQKKFNMDDHNCNNCSSKNFCTMKKHSINNTRLHS